MLIGFEYNIGKWSLTSGYYKYKARSYIECRRCYTELTSARRVLHRFVGNTQCRCYVAKKRDRRATQTTRTNEWRRDENESRTRPWRHSPPSTPPDVSTRATNRRLLHLTREHSVLLPTTLIRDTSIMILMIHQSLSNNTLQILHRYIVLVIAVKKPKRR